LTVRLDHGKETNVLNNPLVLGALALSTLVACRDPDRPRSEEQALKDSWVANASAPRYRMVLSERYPRSGGHPEPWLTVVTIAEFQCSNFEIPGQIENQDGRIRIFLGAVPPTGMYRCIRSMGTASRAFQLPSTDGQYSLEVAAGGLTDRYTLLVSRDTLGLTARTAQFTTVDHPVVQRRPRDHLSARCSQRIAHRAPADDGHCARFFATIGLVAEPFLVPHPTERAEDAYFTSTGAEGLLEVITWLFMRDGYTVMIGTDRGYFFRCDFGRCLSGDARNGEPGIPQR
jgi:hypothetical protein